MNNFEVIKDNPIFKDFSIDEIIETFSVISFYEKEYKKNDLILNENIKLEYFGIIAEGKIAISNFDHFGNRNILNVFEKGETFAEALVALEINIPHEVISLTNSSILWIEYKSLSKSNQYSKILMKYSIILASSEALVGHAYSYSDTVSSFTEGSLTAESTVLRKSCPIPYTQLLLSIT